MRNVFTIGSVAVLGLGVSGGTAAAAPAHALGPPQLVLKLSDLPRGFSLVLGQTESAAQAGTGNGMSASEMRVDGYKTGYLNEYEKKGVATATKLSQIKGLIYAISAVFQFRQASGTHTAYNQLLTAIPKEKSLTGFKMVSLAKVGNESQGYSYHQTVSGGQKITFDFQVFRQGNFIGLTGGGGEAMTLGAQDSAVTNLAKIVDTRIANNK
jgi:hypothetical protein